MWRHIFNGDIGWYGHIDKLVDVVKLTGYRMFAFNGNIYFLDENGNYHKTGMDVDDLEK